MKLKIFGAIIFAAALVVSGALPASAAATSWSNPVGVSTPGQDAIQPQIAVASDGTLTAVWYRFDGSHYVVQSSSSVDKGAHWSGPVDLSLPSQSANSPQVVIALDGTVTVVWQWFDGSNWIVQSSSSVDKGAHWSGPVDLSLPGQNAYSPQVVVASDGTLNAVW